jgi:ribosomal protein S18 acetylase RimI-like enzyme
MNEHGLVAKAGLSEADFAQIRQLETICNQADQISVKLNWDLMQMRTPEAVSDFYYFDQGQLVGYAPLDGFGDQYEVTALVHPTYRRRGIFRQLFAATQMEARRRRAGQLLLVNYRASTSGNLVVARLALPYHNSEYHMEAQVDALPPLPASQIRLVHVTSANVGQLAHLMALNFGAGEWNREAALAADIARGDGRYFLAEAESQWIGHIGVVTSATEAYIRAVGIAPEWRGRGYGRQLLAAMVQKLVMDGFQHFSLDVATDNRNALSLYQSCGFHETNIYDYYTVPLDAQARQPSLV